MDQTVEVATTRKRDDLTVCRIIEAVCFVVFLPIAVLAKLGGWRWRPWPPAKPEGYGSVFDEARSMARMIAGIAISV